MGGEEFTFERGRVFGIRVLDIASAYIFLILRGTQAKDWLGVEVIHKVCAGSLLVTYR